MLGQGVRRRTHCALRAPLKQLRQVSARSACVLRHTHAHPALRFSARAEGNPQPDIHSGLCFARPRLRSARRLRTQDRAERSKGPCGCSAVRLFGCLDVRLSTPCWLRLRRGGCGVSMGACAPMPRHLTRRGCPGGARQRKASSTAHPATAPTQVYPVAKRRGRRLGVALSLVTFFRRSERKLLRRRAHIPAPALGKSMQPKDWRRTRSL